MQRELFAQQRKGNKEFASDLNHHKHQSEIFWMAKQMVKETEYIL